MRARVVADADGEPHSGVPGSQPVRQLIPSCTAEDRLLAGVAERAPHRPCPPPVVGSDASPMGDATPMARTPSPLVAVDERDGTPVPLLGSVTAARLRQHFVGAP